MNAFIQNARLWLVGALCCTSLLLTACYDASESVADSKAAVALAQRFLIGLDTGKSDDLIAISTVPFWGDGELLLEQAEFEKEVRSEASRAGHRMTAFRASHVVPFAEMEALDAEIYHKLGEKIATEGLYAVFLAVESRGISERINAESLLVLVRKSPAGEWRVVGIDD